MSNSVQRSPKRTMPNPHASNLMPRGKQKPIVQQPGQAVDIALPAGTNVAYDLPDMSRAKRGQRKKAFAASKPKADFNKPFQRVGANPFR